LYALVAQAEDLRNFSQWSSREMHPPYEGVIFGASELSLLFGGGKRGCGGLRFMDQFFGDGHAWPVLPSFCL
jgi:hypothetical protein